MSLVYPHLFLMSFALWISIFTSYLFLSPPALLSPYLPSSLSYRLASFCSFFLPPILPPPRVGLCFSFVFRLGLVFGLSPFLLSQAETSVNARYYPSVRLSFVWLQAFPVHKEHLPVWPVLALQLK